MSIKLNLIVAACQGNGIGFKGNLPWKLKNEMAYFTRMTTTVADDMKRNAVIMGRKTWDSIPPKYKPLSKRLNIVLSKSISKVDYEGVLVCESLEKAIKHLEQPLYRDCIESVWVIGGSAIYEAALNNSHCNRVYFTDIKSNFDCDTFFPSIPSTFKRVKDDRVPAGIQNEGGIEYEFQVFEKPSQ